MYTSPIAGNVFQAFKGKEGSSSSFIPSDLGATLKAWYKADAGVLTDGAAQFTAASTQFFSRADNASLSMGAGVLCTFTGWVYFDNTGQHELVTKYDASGTVEYGIETFSNSKFRWIVSPTGLPASEVVVTANTFGAISANTWYFFCAYYDGVNIGISINNGAFDTVAHSTDIFDGTAAFELGALAGPAGVALHNGRMDSIGIWKRVLSGAEITAIYNAGAGVRYTDLSVANKVSNVAWWDFQSAATLVTDSSGNGNTLTNNNAVTFIAGIVSSAAADGDPVTTWQDQSGNSNNATQLTATKRAILKTNIVNGKPIIRFDGVDDWFSLVSHLNFTSFSVFVVFTSRVSVTSKIFIGELTDSATNGWIIGISDATADKTKLYTAAGAGTNLDGTNAFTAGTFGVATGIFDETGAVTKSLFKNGTANGSNTGDTVPATFNGYPLIGAYGNAGAGGQFFDGDIAEIIVCDSALSATNRGKVEAYCIAKYAIV